MKRRSPRRAWFIGPVAIALGVALVPPHSGTAAPAPTPGAAGIDTALPPTESAVMIDGRGGFASMQFTVNQTKELATQAVSVTWTGGERTRQGPGEYAGHYVQIFQCWGDDDGTNSTNPGPPPEQCQQGARTAAPGVDLSPFPFNHTTTRVISVNRTWSNAPAVLASGAGVLDPVSGQIYRPFRPVNGTNPIGVMVDPRFNPAVQGGNYWLNTFFNIITTNEIVGGRTRENGTGSELLQVQTGLDAPGLGCGQKSQPQADASRKVPTCWIVIVPRGDPDDENVGATPFETPFADQAGVQTSPLTPGIWENRIAIPIEFNPVDSPCDLADEERRLVGSESVQTAVTSWQPVLCSTDGLPPYSYAPVGDAAARQQLAASAAGGPGMVLVSRPLAAASANAASPAVYAPISVTGTVIAFNIERIMDLGVPEEQERLKGLRVESINLTPRLVAKLLTQSYRSQVYIGTRAPDYPWAVTNPVNLLEDPDFLQFNPEFEWLVADQRLTGGLQMPSGNFDAASQLWQYLFADPEAKTWLDGTADEFGMKVNPAYSTNPDVNPNGGFGATLPNSFPKADPYCFQSAAAGVNTTIVPTPLCGTDWMPHTRSFAEAASNASRGNDPARIIYNTFAQAPSEVWRRDAPQVAGRRGMLALTDTPSAARFGLQVAALSRAGDNGTSRTFIVPTTTTLTAGVGSMAPGAVPTVLEPAPNADVPGAYPLTNITYAATKPLSLDATARSDYATFVEYAVGPGQTPGFGFGQLPIGYAPLPQQLRDQAIATAGVVRDPSSLIPAPPPSAPTTDTTAPIAVPSGAPSPSAGGASNPAASSALPSAGRPNSGGGGAPGTSPSSGTSETSVPSSEVPPSSDMPATSVPTDEGESPVTTVDTGEEAPPTTTAVALTPGDKLPKARFIVVGLGAMALLSALAALEITKRTRRATLAAGEPSIEFADDPADHVADDFADELAPIERTLLEQTVDA